MRAPIILSCLILLTLQSFSRDIDSIIDTVKVWYTHIYIYCCEQVDTEVIGISQDTIIDDTTYNKILRATGGNTIPFLKYGFIREDSLHRIYYKTTVSSPERLIYDFSIQEGDSTKVFGLMDWEKDDFISCNYICDSIRNKGYFGNQRKVYYLSTSPGHNYEHWIEGLGSSSGLLHNYDGQVGDDAFYLSCVYSRDSLLYKKYATCVRIALDVNTITANNPLIFPNPVGTNQYLQIRHTKPGCILEVYNARGTLVHKQILDSSEIVTRFNVDRGIYLYRIIENRKGSVYSGKLIFE